MKTLWPHPGYLALSLVVVSHSAVPASEVIPEPLHQKIDALVAAGNVTPPAPASDDATFARRLYLDLCGRIPAADEVRAFLGDPSANKRALLVERLLASRDNTLHLAATFDRWLMERRRDEHVKKEAWRDYLVESFAAGKPYNQLAAEILAADGTEEAIRPAARFYLDRKAEPHLLTRDVGRIFFGKDLQCAQCHNHPNIDDYLQEDYYGLFGFFKRTSLFQPDTKKPALLAEKAEGEATFASVFTKVKGRSLPHAPGGPNLRDPDLKPEDRYKVKPDKKKKNVRPVPAYSRRARPASLVGEGKNAAFQRNIVNRLWKHMMGTGLVEPVDFHHAANPPSHPELLDLLAEAFVEMEFDVRAFLRELALTETYQRSFALPDTLQQQAGRVRALIPQLQEEADRLLEAAGEAGLAFDDAKEAWTEAVLQHNQAKETHAAAAKHLAEATTAHQEASAAVEPLQQKLVTMETASSSLEQAATNAARAVELLEEDPELARAATTIKERVERQRARIQTTSEELAAKTKMLEQADARLQEARTAAEEAQARTRQAEEKVMTASEALRTARDRNRAEQRASRTAARRLDDAQQLVAYAQAQAKAAQARDAARPWAGHLAGLHASAQASRQQAEALAGAVDRLQSALARMPADAELESIVARLTSQSAGASQEATALAQSLATRHEAAQTQAATAAQAAAQAAAAMEALTRRWSTSFALGVFEPLTPEQLCSSMMQASGYLDQVRTQGDAAFDRKLKEQEEALAKQADADGTNPDAGEQAEEAKPVLSESDRAAFVERHVREKTNNALREFVKLFGGQPGQPQTDFFATADQALFLANDGLVRGWLRPSGDNLTARLERKDDAEALARELYLSVLSRNPEPAEVAHVERMLGEMAEQKSIAVQEMAWALLSSVEFRFRH